MPLRGKKKWFYIIKATFREFSNDNAFNYSAALSYYTIFSLPPIIIIIISIAGSILSKEQISGEIYQEIQTLLGPDGASQIKSIVEGTKTGKGPVYTKIISIITLLFGSTGVFIALQTSLNAIWGIKAKPKYGILKHLKDRAISLAMIASLSFLLLVSLIVNALLNKIIQLFHNHFQSTTIHVIKLMNILIPFSVITLLLALIFKFLPDGKISWKDVWTGALFTAILFTLGKLIIGLYLGNSNISSAYGAAGTIILILLWVFYSSIILYLGAEFTKIHSRIFGRSIEPSEYAVKFKKITL